MKKFIVLLHGPMGSGKTTASKNIHNAIQPSVRIALPDLRRLVSGNHRDHASITKEIMLELTDAYLSRGLPVVVELVCKEGSILQYRELATKHNCVFLPYYLFADPVVRWDRVCTRTAEMMNVSKLPESKIAELQPIFDENKLFYAQSTGDLGAPLDTTNVTQMEVLERIQTDLQIATS